MPVNETTSSIGSMPAWSRPVAISTAVLFFISWVFPLAAGLSRNTASFPRWWGRLDVSLAFALVVLVFAIMAVAQGKVDKRAEDATYRAYRILLHGILGICVVFFFFGNRISWINCLTGFAWRTWLLLYALPAWLAASWNMPATQVGGQPRHS